MSGRRARILIAVQALLAAAFVTFLLVRQDVHLPGDDGYRVTVSFANAGGLRSSDRSRVTISGVPSGRVASVRYVRGRAVAVLRLDDAARGVLRRGTTASVVPRSPLNDLMVDLTPGPRTAPALAPGSVVEAGAQAAPVGLDEVLSSLDTDTRAYLQALVAGLGHGVRGAALARDLRALDPAAAASARVTELLSERRRDLRALVGDVADIVGQLGARGEDLRGALRNGRAVLDVTARERAAVTAIVAQLPATLSELDRGLAASERLAGPLVPALTRLRPAARELPGAFAALRASAPEARRLVAAIDALARDGGAPARALNAALVQAGPAASALRAPVAKLEPITAAIDAKRDGIGTLGERFSGIFSTNDPRGPVLRGLGFFEEIKPENLGFPPSQKARAQRALVTALTRVCLTSNPIACLVRYLVPGLPGSVRSAAAPVGSASAARAHALVRRPSQRGAR